MRSLPVPDRSLPYIEIRRELRTEDLEVTYPSGDSYDLTLEETRLVLMQLGVPELKREKALDKVWNFYAIKIHLQQDYRYETLEPPRYPELGGRPLEPWAWVIEPGRTK